MTPHPTPLATILLASTSPRRREILRLAGVDHEAIHPGVDDGALAPRRSAPAAWAASMAFFKARAGLDRWREQFQTGRRLVVGADTICVHGASIVGQPQDESHAREILTRFDDEVHEVITGVAVIDSETGRREIFVDQATVWWEGVGRDRIEAYLETGRWRGKAGAYNLAERLDAEWPIRYEGSPNTIMGLPIELLRARLERMATPSVEPAA